MKPLSMRRPRAARRIVPAALVIMAWAHAAGAQGVQVALTPDSLAVSVGAEFDLDLTMTQPGSPFNGFDATVTWDPAALTLLPLSPVSLQEGCLMTGACSNACGNTFHRFATEGDSAAITDILLCDQIALTGPGQIYRLRFRASDSSQVTHVRFRRARFYNEGVYVNPVTTADAHVTIGTPLDAGGIAAVGPGVRLRVMPNPAHRTVTVALEVDTPGEQRVEVHDLAGRQVRRLDHGWRREGSRRLTWDGLNERGAPAPSGIYVVTLRAAGRAARVRVALLRR